MTMRTISDALQTDFPPADTLPSDFLARFHVLLEGQDGLTQAAEHISEAIFAKQEGHGPAQDEITKARRTWLNRFEAQYD